MLNPDIVSGKNWLGSIEININSKLYSTGNNEEKLCTKHWAHIFRKPVTFFKEHWRTEQLTNIPCKSLSTKIIEINVIGLDLSISITFTFHAHVMHSCGSLYRRKIIGIFLNIIFSTYGTAFVGFYYLNDLWRKIKCSNSFEWLIPNNLKVSVNLVTNEWTMSMM